MPIKSLEKYRTICPYCGANMFIGYKGTEICEILWNASNSSFSVKVRLGVCSHCSPEDHKVEIARSIPLAIARDSACTCGASMILEDHKITTDKESITFEGRYVCAVCGRSQDTLFTKIAEGLRKFWETTRKITIGPNGVSYEKAGSQDAKE
jgi:ribosomal protein S27AE